MGREDGGPSAAEAAPGVTTPIVVPVSGEIDIATAPALREKLLDAVGRGDGPVVVDLGDVAFMDSSGLAVLVSASNRLRSTGRELVLRGVGPAVLSALRITRLDLVLRIDEAPLVAET